MGQLDTSNAFARAMETADCETLIAQIADWFDKPYRDPTNALDIAACVQSGVHAGFARKIEAAKRAWRMAEAEQWEASRSAFDSAMRAAVGAIVAAPNNEPQHDWTPRSDQPGGELQHAWGSSQSGPAIGSGWGRPSA
jgi:hypothetical protein